MPKVLSNIIAAAMSSLVVLVAGDSTLARAARTRRSNQDAYLRGGGPG
jgi:hypothetical protein